MPTASESRKSNGGKTTASPDFADSMSIRLALDRGVRELIYRSCLRLDEMNFKAFMELCDPEFHYIISAYSPELRKEIVWLDHDWQGLNLLFEVFPKHVSDNVLRLKLSRHVTVYTIDYTEDFTHADVVSALQVFTTTKNGGATSLLGVARYRDTVRLADQVPRLLTRHVELETRLLGETGCHIPF